MESRFTERAIAYLKETLPKNGSPSVKFQQEDMPILRPYCDGLCICYVVDHENSYHFVQQRHLTADGVSAEQLHLIGLRNLMTLIGKRDLRVQPYQNIFAVLAGGDFEASLILLDQLWTHRFRQFIAGEFAVAIPNRDILAFCDVTSAVGLAELRQLIGRINPTGDHPISDKIYVRDEYTWRTMP